MENGTVVADLQEQYAAAARLIDEADAFIICAGAAMGVDSWRPDFRGAEGFWKRIPRWPREAYAVVWRVTCGTRRNACPV